ncbi:unnamed protein product [Blepharisma stoltei]|uniref:Uncharacterized protein n=1 Tax=Blepharisma stoltei TaxID=1481888 RepID=A0AAU9K6U7_9CILI|nr:unnamed protein product [Blepharisma stoltei]
MSDFSKEIPLNQQIIKELFELRQFKSEKDTITRANQYYVAQVSQMEVKISELKALLQAKDEEIVHLKEIIKQQVDKNSKLSSLKNSRESEEQESQSFKNKESNNAEIEKLKDELEFANKMKETFEEKYREAKALLVKAETKDIDEDELNEFREENEVLRSENTTLKRETIPKLQTQLEDAQHQRFQIETQVQAVLDENDELRNKVRSYEILLEEIQKEGALDLAKFKTSNRRNQTASTTESEVLKTNFSQMPEAYMIKSEFLPPVNNEGYLDEENDSESPPLAKSPRKEEIKALNLKSISMSSQKSETSLRHGSTSVRSSTPTTKAPAAGNVDYVPSFMRNKKPAKKKKTFEISL